MLVETTPIPVKFDRQCHSCNFYGALWPTVHMTKIIVIFMSYDVSPLDNQEQVVKSKLVLQLGRYMKLVSQRSLHNAPIFRLLLKVAVNGTHQCDLSNFCGGLGSQQETFEMMQYGSRGVIAACAVDGFVPLGVGACCCTTSCFTFISTDVSGATA